MEKILTLILLFSPLTLLGQESECCENVREVEKYLNGHWQKEGGDSVKLYEFHFSEGIGKAVIYNVREDGTKEKISGSEAAISVSKEDHGLFLIYDWKHSIIEHQIIYLDSAQLTLGLGTKRLVKLYKASHF